MVTGSTVLLELLVSCDGGRGPTQMRAHTHTKKDLIFATVACWEDTLWLCGCGNKAVWYFCDIFIRTASNVRNNKSKSHGSQLFLAHLIQYQLFFCVASQTHWVYRGEKKELEQQLQIILLKRKMLFQRSKCCPLIVDIGSQPLSL